MTKIIGLTGGIGSGKTMVAKYIESLGIPVYIADDEAKKLMNTKKVISEITDAFGNEVIENGDLNRERIAQIVFNDTEKLQKLNSIIHPKVKAHFEDWLKKQIKSSFVVKEAAILFETAGDTNCDEVITVIAPIETRIQRVIERDKTDKESVLKRMQSQWTDEQRIAKSNYIITNISVKDTYNQIDKILNILKNQ